MRSLVGVVVAVLAVTAGCSGGSDGEAQARPTPARSTAPSMSLASVDVAWPRAGDELDAPKVPAAPGGFPAGLISRMAGVLTDWATETTLDDDVRHSGSPVDEVADELPAEVDAALRAQTKDAVSPRLRIANVLADDVDVVGAPAVTTAWKVAADTDEAGRRFVLLQLQTRAAYEVRTGADGPVRVIGVLRVHGLSAYPGTTTDFGVSGGWQEFGAGDCALALDDHLVPDTDIAKVRRDLATFVEVGDGDQLVMPALDDEEQVDVQYLKRCRDSAT
jgi:hypothetical protein